MHRGSRRMHLRARDSGSTGGRRSSCIQSSATPAYKCDAVFRQYYRVYQALRIKIEIRWEMVENYINTCGCDEMVLVMGAPEKVAGVLAAPEVEAGEMEAPDDG